ncbi:MAG TPA: glutathione S-transferase family protein [Polyangiales bacterium]
MSHIVLYSARACPYAHRTRLVLAHKGVPFELFEVDLQNKPSWFADVSGYGKVPAIEHDGQHLWESAVVNEYLDEVFPEPALAPSNPLERARGRIWVDYANTRFVSAFGALLRGESGPGELESALRYFEREGLNRHGQGGPFFFGARPSLVDFAFYPWFERWDALAHYRAFDVPNDLTRLAAWRDSLRALPSVVEQASPTEFYVERWARYAPAEKSGNKPGDKHKPTTSTARSTP